MLIEIHIRDFAIIDDLSLELEPGFVVFTGETGAGKSILIDAVEMVLGGRAETTAIRSGASAALIDATFRLTGSAGDEVRPMLEAQGLLEDSEILTLSREIRREGRSLCRVNGRVVNLALLKEVGDILVDVHGQSEHLSLMRVREHLNLLDRYAQAEEARQAFHQTYEALGRVRSELASLRQSEREAARRAEMLAFQINEIEAAALRPEEERELLEERTRLANAEQLAALAEKAIAALDESVDQAAPATDLLGQVAEAVASLARVDGSMTSLQAESQALLEQAGDLARRIRLYREGIEFNPRRLDEVEERIGLIRSLQRKYGDSVTDVLAYADKARRELDTITHAEERIQALEMEERELLASLAESGQRLSEIRREAGGRLGQAVEGELSDLRMAGARFGVDLRWEDEPTGVPVGERRLAFGPAGLDRVEFLVAPNPGEGLKPLVKIASGGETSRLMLGLKGVLARADRTPTLIFDEIDQGIGGRVGAVVGQKLWGLARQHQVLCITHLPQLAAFGDQHFKVEKIVKKGRTVTTVWPLQGEPRIAELAQMLGGTGEATQESAADLLRQAAAAKAVP
ncbi:MAG: DNA repair protein RecN [Chloroflexota bacterium]